MNATHSFLAMTPGKPSVLVTGASGNLGREVTHRLRSRGVDVRGFDRAPAKRAESLKWHMGDISDPQSFATAIEDVDTVFLTWPLLDSGPAEGVIATLAAKSPRVVYLSSSAVEDARKTQTDPIVQVHADMEALLHDAGLQPVVLRSDTLASNTRGWIAQLRRGDVVTGPKFAPTAVVDERDVADAVVSIVSVSDDRFGRGPHVLTGPSVLDRADQVAQLGEVLQRPLRFEPASFEEARRHMLADGRPPALVEALLDASQHRPASRRVTDALSWINGRPATTFAQWAVDHASEFR
ncbi:uncharacterized protein YbjT (DUF2867 family) [Stackebrandtia endophytica]|uniref:Uncharacterized protein YbjT (DUF2867 family) n=1 Tax=Stackebrandtia endophytica TaxID=1496996 RepID=A0A543B2E4_9ACTN|nr:NAD(P)H-binding protein [Stackebrandtia endophytica]TQL79003.1 uncharacterized protein YbjT (DUF2867 family) [Stackebrandtia endophytica]